MEGPQVSSKSMDGPRHLERMTNMPTNWRDGVVRNTKYTGIYETKKGYRVRVRAVDPRTGTMKGANREFERITLQEALAKQVELRAELLNAQRKERVRVGDFAKLWIESKAPTV